MFGLSFVEIAIVAVLALLLLGPDQLPSVAKTLGKGLRELRKASDDLKGTFETEMNKLEREVEQAQAEKPAAPAWTAPAAAPVVDAGAAPTADPAQPAPAASWPGLSGAGAGLAPVVPLDQLRQMASQDPGALRALARQNAVPRDPGTARAAARFAARAQQTAAAGVPPGIAALAASIAPSGEAPPVAVLSPEVAPEPPLPAAEPSEKKPDAP